MSVVTSPYPVDHWQKAELLHTRFSLLSNAARNYALYAELYARQGNGPKFYACLARAEELNALATTHRFLELHEWRLAHHYKLSSKQSQRRLQRAFLLMAKTYIVSCIAWVFYVVIHLG